MKKRVVITGMGVVAPNAHGLDAFAAALREGRSGIRRIDELAELNFACQVGGIPENFEVVRKRYFDHEKLMSINDNIGYASVAAIDAWRDAGFEVPEGDGGDVDWDTGVILGSGIGGMDTIARTVVPMVNAGRVRRMGSRIVEQVMNSGTSARIAGLLALGNQVTSNSSACSTGNEAIVAALWRIRTGLAKRMLAGGSEGASPYIWSGFDAMRVICRKFNDAPERASRPMSASAGGFVPGAGGAVLVLEELETARRRGARIYAEVAGGAVNCGGQRRGGSMTAPNPDGVRRCIEDALADAAVSPGEIQAINGHLTATYADPVEVKNWSATLGRPPGDFPYINSTKSMIGHCLGAAGAIESVATVLQLQRGFLHPSVNCEDIHPEIEAFNGNIPRQGLDMPELRCIAKAGFGFGDVNSCLIFKKWEEN
ncbi:MAG TPA: beta-ketoacyl-[acyl-carrier-protein] synthase family protein [Syntrophales bacterium]|nr:beta-ketoacyl-[acyl-carrier-protein] synthase family protein [Syntrophales bacterium]HOU77460.1 beta-ketoacyl-[acyl-carrier-protein] synthase family protein [Syntrophales bacterium]HPC31798.1 beta-ketoacyl-[acyl-carrier-protein] synthase family protein [Syntrophales bacterium]HQI34633.1 beta-ketoacyl-[acyl-carrier-protein] synthase family protein [Syntrophales bacterium]HQJ30536.1 beta-ketoacyl-[acyl-carrier-protein] synthase family protein [Syntrophales bacterium]